MRRLRMICKTSMLILALLVKSSVEGQDLRQTIEADLVRVEGGTFIMGCTAEQGSDCMSAEEPAVPISVSTFYLSKYEVTQSLWVTVMGENPSDQQGCGNCPVEGISWEDAQFFIQNLSTKTGTQYRLPTEAEWEYAARGGEQSRGTKYSGSASVDEVAWCGVYRDGNTHPVGQKAANEIGLFDMSGNVAEYCEDWYSGDTYRLIDRPNTSNPQGPDRGNNRVMRGGSFNSHAKNCRVSYRTYNRPDNRLLEGCGLRIARSE